MSKVIILASSRRAGNTEQLAELYKQESGATIINLLDYHINYYDYDNKHQQDDFKKVVDDMLAFETLVFASPVYWYAPSALMKTFLDRITDLLTVNKAQGRKLKVKNAQVLSTGASSDLASSFEDIFRLTAKYLGMQYQGMLYCDCTEGFNAGTHRQSVRDFIQKAYANNETD